MTDIATVQSLTLQPDTNAFARVLGEKQYELSNHLGNVLTTISDQKKAIQEGTTGTVSHWTADVVSYSDYYPFGMMMTGRNGGGTDAYRYGFQGQETDDKVYGEGNAVSYKYRIHDPRVGRFFSVDPLFRKYPYWAPYAFSGNQVTVMIEQEGLQPANNRAGANPENYESIAIDNTARAEPVKSELTNGIEVEQISFGIPSVANKAQQELQKFTLRATRTPLNQVNRQNAGLPTTSLSTVQSGVEIAATPPILKIVGTSGKMTLKGGKALLANPNIATVASKSSSRAFFSGAGTEARAINEGFTTLSQTRAGQNLMKMTEGMPYYPGSQAYNWWARLSSTYAKGIPKGSYVNVFLNNPSPTGIWNAVEKPILQQRGINIIYR